MANKLNKYLVVTAVLVFLVSFSSIIYTFVSKYKYPLFVISSITIILLILFGYLSTKKFMKKLSKTLGI